MNWPSRVELFGLTVADDPVSYAMPVLEPACPYIPACLHSEDGITLHTVVGVYEWERVDVRPLVFDLRLESAQPLNLNRTLIAQRLNAWLEPCRYRLLEALAEHLAQCMLSEWRCSRVIIGIEKPGALGDIARVGIRIARDAEPICLSQIIH